ncbi:MAG: aromatic amino acid lyase, partial [Prevotella sp.]
MATHFISAEHLTIERIGEIIRNGEKIELSEEAKQRIRRCRSYLDKKIASNGAPVYGVTTGFGSLCNVSIGREQLSQLQINLIKSHACGVGERVPNDIVKIMMLLKVQSLSYGYSGCKLDTVQRLVQFINNDVYPVVYRQGSLGASGDLVPLAHLCLPLIGLGEVEYQGKVISGEELCRKKRWKPIELASKEGLALLNGTQNMSAFAVWSLLEAQRLSEWADKIAAMSLDAFDGRIEAFLPLTHKLRTHEGQLLTAER